MERVLKGLEPESVFKNFEALTQIPRESGNEAAVADFLERFAKGLGLEVIKEPSNNLIITKPATPGYENAKTVILQGHTDMVCVKLDTFDFDFNSQPIPLVIDGDFIKTKGTTLGADNGIAVAMTMSILESNDLEHPKLVALFTTNEETGMDGVMSLDPEHVKGDILINLDSEEEGTLLASCAGGVKNITEIDMDLIDHQDDLAYNLVISGLAGGHSGIEIGKNRANAIKLMGRTLSIFKAHFPFSLFEIHGGEKMNAIAKRSEMRFTIASDTRYLMEDLVESIEETFKSEYEVSDPAIKIEVTKCDMPQKVFDQDSTDKIEKLLRLTPFGVYTMSAGMPGLVESSNNLGVLEQNGNTIKLINAVRSSVKSKKQELNEMMGLICESVGGRNALMADYPEWPYKVESKIRDLMKETYLELYGKELKVDAIHAGLECGFLKEKVGDIDMISLGPNMHDVHTPFERLSIGSTARTYAFLCEVLKRIK
ncbi:MAG TPA: aminoacyl-histidine dipeptidase [Clostridiales bacterium UBA8960]|jgi:dipeptidase D|nr:aminoacyl-histidine dipeptidase [Clostridiales bacterium UBA8960]